MSPSTPDDTAPDPGLPEDGMDSGSDAGEFGTHLSPEDLQPDEEYLLAALEREAAARAAEDDTPLPGKGGPPDDGLTPWFSDSG